VKSVQKSVVLFALLAISLSFNLLFLLRTTVYAPFSSYVVWNVPTTLSAHSYLFSSMFDTFEMSVTLNANSSVYVYVFTPTEYVWFQTNSASPPSYAAFYSGKYIHFVWNLSEGCGGYLWVVYNPSAHTVLITPYVVATYHPSTAPTGVCAEKD
jgi:hypothetical protein